MEVLKWHVFTHFHKFYGNKTKIIAVRFTRKFYFYSKCNHLPYVKYPEKRYINETNYYYYFKSFYSVKKNDFSKL